MKEIIAAWWFKEENGKYLKESFDKKIHCNPHKFLCYARNNEIIIVISDENTAPRHSYLVRATLETMKDVFKEWSLIGAGAMADGYMYEPCTVNTWQSHGFHIDTPEEIRDVVQKYFYL